MPCAVIISRDRLQALVEAHHYHHEHKGDAVHDTVSANCKVSAVFAKLLVYEQVYQTGCGVHKERSQTYGKRLPCNPPVQLEKALGEMRDPGPVKEETERIGKRHQLAKDGRYGRPLDSQSQRKDENGVQDGVRSHCKEGKSHCHLWLSAGAYGAVQAKIQMGNDIAYEDDCHILPCKGERVVAGSEETQYRIQESQHKRGENQADGNVQGKDVAQNLAGVVIVLLAQQDGHQGHSAHSHQGAQRGGKVHKGECDGKSGNGVGTHILYVSDVDAVHHIVQRSRGLGNYSRDRVHSQKRTNILGSKLGRSRC